MQTILNLAQVRKKMKNKPVGNRLYQFFDGGQSLTVKQIENLKAVIEKEHEANISFIEKQLQSL